MAPTIDEVCSATDAALASGGLRLTGSGYVARSYLGQLGGCPARGQLSVFVNTNQMTLASGYRLSIEIDTGVAARFVAGKNIPLLLGGGLTEVAAPWPALPGQSFKVHDTAWAQRFTHGSAATSAVTVLHHAEFLEHRPGLLQAQVAGRHPHESNLPAILSALAVLTQTTVAPPAPTPARARWSDNRGLVVALIAVLVLGVLFVGAALLFLYQAYG